MLPAESQARIDEARTRMTVTMDGSCPALALDPQILGTIRVGGMSNGGWIIFAWTRRGLEVIDMASNLRYDSVITGTPVPPWWEANAAWEVARVALGDPSKVLPAVHTLHTGRITSGIATYLAMKSRVDAWGGFTDEKIQLPALLARLSDAERRVVAERIEGKPVV